VSLTECVLREESAPMRLSHDDVHQFECYVLRAPWSDGGRHKVGRREKDL
jgi:hypothetical protein